MDMFESYEDVKRKEETLKNSLEKEKMRQRTLVDIQRKYGKNAALKASNLKEESTTRQRNEQIGGHKA